MQNEPHITETQSDESAAETLATPATDNWKDEAYRSAIKPDELQKDPYRSSIVPAELPPEVQARADEPVPVAAPQLSDVTRLGLGVIGAALIAGIAGDALLRRTPWGINLPVWFVMVIAAVALLIRKQRPELLGEARWLALPLLFFSASFAWRDSVTLHGLAIVAILITLSLFVFRSRQGRLVIAGLSEYIKAGLCAATSIAGGSLLLLFGDVKWSEVSQSQAGQRNWSRHLGAVGRGLLIAAPLLLIFGGLLVAADAAFENIVTNAFDFDLGVILSHITMAGFIAWLAGGYLRALMFPATPIVLPGLNAGATAKPQFLTLGIVEITIVLGLLNLLFLAFVIVQFQYFFGGAANLRPGSGMAYAMNARRGFFELVGVTTLVLPMLLGFHWLLRKDNHRHELIYRGLAGGMIAMLFVMMASAIQRMRLYQVEFGMTELRFYTTAFMGWLAIVFVWFALTVLRGQRARFAFGAVLTGLAMIAALHVVNPDYWIARTNLTRAADGRFADLNYSTRLSADSVSAIAEKLDALNATDQQVVKEKINQREWSSPPAGWRAWNWSRARAAALMNQ